MLGYFRQNIKDYLRANIVIYFFLVLVFIGGVVVGALAVKTLPDEQKLELISYLRMFFQGLSEKPGNEGTAELLITVLINNVKSVALMWLLGFTVVGVPFVLFIIFTRGFVIGFTVGFLINEYVIKGLLFAMVSVLPHNFIAIPAIIITGVSATSFSMMLVRRRQKAKANLLYESVGYTVLCVLMMVLMVLAALVEVYVSPVFMKLTVNLFL